MESISAFVLQRRCIWQSKSVCLALTLMAHRHWERLWGSESILGELVLTCSLLLSHFVIGRRERGDKESKKERKIVSVCFCCGQVQTVIELFAALLRPKTNRYLGV